MQLINVVRGGTLDQHLADTIDITPHRADDRTLGRHDVITVAGTLGRRDPRRAGAVQLAPPPGSGDARNGLIASAHAPDGVIEAIEDPGLRFCLGVRAGTPTPTPPGAGRRCSLRSCEPRAALSSDRA